VVLSEVFDGSPMLLVNFWWALGFAVLLTVRDALEPITRRRFNIAMFGTAIVLMLVEMFMASNTTADLLGEGLVAIACSYCLHKSYSQKP
jgi:hypothetical protein